MTDKVIVIIGIFSVLVSISLSGFKNEPFRIDKNHTAEQSRFQENSQFLNVDVNSGFGSSPTNPAFKKIKQSIKIHIPERNLDGTGTAFKLNSKSWVTARHVVNGCSQVYLIDAVYKGTTKTNIKQLDFVNRIFTSGTSDLAILTPKIINTDDLLPEAQFSLSLYKEDLIIGEHGFSVGFPKGAPGQALLKFGGYVNMIQSGAYHLKEPVKMWVEFTREPRNLDNMGGISGGPIFNSGGSIVGVHVANSIRRGRAFSVDINAISGFLNVTNTRYNTAISKNPPVIDLQNWKNVADKWRNERLIRKVLCKTAT